MNVIPTFSLKNLHNAVLAYAALSSKLSSWLDWMLCSDFKNKFCGEFGLVVCVSNSRRPPPSSTLGNFVMHIVRMSSKEQVGWIYASRIVAAVKNTFSIRDSSKTENPRKPVREHSPRSPSTKTERAVSKVVFASSPKPTAFSFVYHIPKAIRNRVGASNISKAFDWVRNRLRPSDWSGFNHGGIVDTNSMGVNT